MINVRDKASMVRRDRIAAAIGDGGAPLASNDSVATSAAPSTPVEDKPAVGAPNIPPAAPVGKGDQAKFRRYTIMLDEDVGRRLRLLAVERGVKLHALTTEIVTAYLAEQKG